MPFPKFKQTGGGCAFGEMDRLDYAVLTVKESYGLSRWACTGSEVLPSWPYSGQRKKQRAAFFIFVFIFLGGATLV